MNMTDNQTDTTFDIDFYNSRISNLVMQHDALRKIHTHSSYIIKQFSKANVGKNFEIPNWNL